LKAPADLYRSAGACIWDVKIMKRKADYITGFSSLVMRYKPLPFVTIESFEHSVRFELNPKDSSHCYLAIEVDADGNVLMLVDSTGTFDNIGYDEITLASAIDDVLEGRVIKFESSAFGLVYRSVITLINSGLRHSSTNPWLLPLCIFSMSRTTEVQFEAYPI
jgi:hypothetical protein